MQGYSTIFYDQCGCGASSFVKDPKKDAPQLLTVDFYVQELAKLVQELQLTRFYVYGSSWGSMLAQVAQIIAPFSHCYRLGICAHQTTWFRRLDS